MTREPHDNDPHNERNPHAGYDCPSYAESVRAEPLMEPITDRLYDWWSQRGGR